MIITRLTGGLGNQMFQYAAGLALAEQHRTVLKLDASWFRLYGEYEAHNRYALSCLNITEQFATAEEVERAAGLALTRSERWSVALARWLRFYQYVRRMTSTGNRFHRPSLQFFPEFFQQPDHTYLDGMWQSEQYFTATTDLLRLHFNFRYTAPPAVRALAEQIRSGPSAAVHFRRGDYARNPTFNREIGLLGLDYYHRALEQLYAQHPRVTLYIFSDDIDAVERDFKPPGPLVFARVTQPWHSYDKIRLMSQCNHAIVSNSTFAWWAAWLNPNPTKLVIAPDPWLAGKPEESRDVVPVSWVHLAAGS